MLKELRIRNLAIIADCVLEFDPAYTVLTGETGAGKSILVDGLTLALGDRADKDLIRAGAAEAVVEALFDVSANPSAAAMLAGLEFDGADGELLLRRVVTAAGKTRCAINGTPIPLALLKRLGDQLVDLHGQHEHQLLLDVAQHALFLDAFGELLPQRERVAAGYRAWREAEERLLKLQGAERGRSQRLDLLQFQIDEIGKAALKPGEEAALTAERARLAHAARLSEALARASEALTGEGGAREALGTAASALKAVADLDPADLAPVLEAVQRLAGFAADEAANLRQVLGKLEADPGRLEAVEERLDLLARLKRKYGDTEEEILRVLDRAKAELAELTGAEEQVAEARAALEAARAALSEGALHLSADRQRVADRFADFVARELRELAMEGADFGVRMTQNADPAGPVVNEDGRYHATAEGIDVVEFYLAPNVGEGTKPLRAIASGGELSRVMLALKAVLARVDRVGTLVFDEIDTGIGGRVAETVGRKLQDIGEQRQVIGITHLPQIAARAARHLIVRKTVEGGHTTVSVDAAEGRPRVEELARMLAGAEVTPTALKHAEALLQGG